MAVRPQNFTKTVTAAEKKLLQELLEKALGVSRPKAAPGRQAGNPRFPEGKHEGKSEAMETASSDARLFYV